MDVVSPARMAVFLRVQGNNRILPGVLGKSGKRAAISGIFS
jgi:hypothetical protein